MTDLSKIHTYYIYSLSSFIQVFYRGIDKVTSEPSEGDWEEEEEEEQKDVFDDEFNFDEGFDEEENNDDQNNSNIIKYKVLANDLKVYENIDDIFNTNKNDDNQEEDELEIKEDDKEDDKKDDELKLDDDNDDDKKDDELKLDDDDDDDDKKDDELKLDDDDNDDNKKDDELKLDDDDNDDNKKEEDTKVEEKVKEKKPEIQINGVLEYDSIIEYNIEDVPLEDNNNELILNNKVIYITSPFKGYVAKESLDGIIINLEEQQKEEINNQENSLDLEESALSFGEESASMINKKKRKIKVLSDEELLERCKELIDSITLTIFNYLRRGLFERHKLTAATLLMLKIAVNDGLYTQEEVDFLLHGKLSTDPGNMGPLHEWITETQWARVKALEALGRFQNLGDDMQSDSDEWLDWFDNEQPETSKLPGSYNKSLEPFDRLILLRALRPDRVPTALRSFISNLMGSEYVYQDPFDMLSTYDETSNITPTFFVLFPGVDPTPWVENLGKKFGISLQNDNFINISMGQGQEKPAEDVLERYAKTGGWVMLQNCHLMQSWLPKLERLLEIVQETAHENFRCFLSAEPPPLATMKNMPESLLQSCIKVANEAPSDIKSNLMRGWSEFDQTRLEESSKVDTFKTCLFSLCWFHSIVLGRKRFGSTGWSKNYSFNLGDLNICANILQAYIDANNVIPWDDLRYIFGEIMYGGHITDPWDRRTNKTYLEVIFNEKIFENGELGPGFKSPSNLDYNGYIEYINTELPEESPILFGLHPNAEIGFLTNSCESIFKSILLMQGTSDGGSGSASSEDSITKTLNDLLDRLPEEFEMITLGMKAKELLNDESSPFVVVALQECNRMNALIHEIRRSLIELDKGIKGQLNMSQSMDDLAVNLAIGQVPGRDPFHLCSWEKLAWPSKKGLISWFNDLLKRIEQLQKWSEEFVTPVSLWLPGLFNPTGFLTAIMQVSSRRTGLPLDKMTISTSVTTYLSPNEVEAYPENGMFVHGLFLQGARWPTQDDLALSGIADDVVEIDGVPCGGFLSESRLKELMPPMPLLYIQAVEVQSTWLAESVGYLRNDPGLYEAPVYITTFRGPTYVFLATLKTVDPVSKWILNGVCLCLQDD